MDSNLEMLINEYIKKCRYTWSVDEIIIQFNRWIKGEYVSHTAKDVIKKCIMPYINSLVNY